jgi:hypothetical protein
MEDVIEQMKKIQSRIGSMVDNSNKQNQPESKGSEIVGGEGIEIKTDGCIISLFRFLRLKLDIGAVNYRSNAVV